MTGEKDYPVANFLSIIICLRTTEMHRVEKVETKLHEENFREESCADLLASLKQEECGKCHSFTSSQ